MTEKIVRFNSDTKHRKQWFTGLSFSHPAKMALPLQLWIIGKYTKAGETILDPMAGSGTLLVACSMGRHVIAVELEQKFVDMMKGYDCDGKIIGFREDYVYDEEDERKAEEKGEDYIPRREMIKPITRCGLDYEHTTHHVFGNWEKIQERGCQLGYSMGTATILQGDAKNLTGMLVDKVLFSPPYQETRPLSSHEPQRAYTSDLKREIKESHLVTEGNIGNLPYGNVDKIITSPPYADQVMRSDQPDRKYEIVSELVKKGGKVSKRTESWIKAYPKGRQQPLYQQTGEGAYNPNNPNNIGNLPYGQVDKIISSPPYEGTEARDRSKEQSFEREQSGKYPKRGDVNISAGYQGVDAVISSPPYENQLYNNKQGPKGFLWGKDMPHSQVNQPQGYSDNQANIGNLKNDSYLQAMLQVYQQCHAVLRPDGLMILVTKNFIRNKKQVRLDLDTIKLCEQAGFVYQDRWYRELTSTSFWRTIYKQRYPEAPEIKYEDILVFQK